MFLVVLRFNAGETTSAVVRRGEQRNGDQIVKRCRDEESACYWADECLRQHRQSFAKWLSA